MILSDSGRQLLERLSAEGKSTRLFAEDLPLAKALEVAGLLFLIGQDEPYAVITQRGDTSWQSSASRRYSNRPAASWNSHASELNTAGSKRLSRTASAFNGFT